MRNFSARETEWLQELDGIELASFKRRTLAFLLDWIFVGVTLVPILLGGVWGYLRWREAHGRPVAASTNIILAPGMVKIDEKNSPPGEKSNSKFIEEAADIVIPVLYFGLLTWRGKGRSPGKRIFKIRVVSLVHRHLTLWHSIERALGYGAAALEGGFGFIQFFIHPYRRCVQDRIAETIVVTERGYQLMQAKASHPLLPDTGNLAQSHIADESLPSTN